MRRKSETECSAVRRCLTPRSSGAPTAGHQARSGGTRYIFASPGLASCGWRPLSSNVRLFGGLMKHFFTALFVLTIASQAYAQKTPYGSCPERAQAYQERYERSQRSQDLVCYQKALERELNGQNGYSCPNSSQHYQNAYERNQRSSDLVCFQKALERELQ